MYIILIGAQGSGKGTQAELLAQTFDLQQVASGDLFRKAFEERRELPERVP
jgi:adenylate kinase